ncbi:MAG: hypothetical protein ACR2J8_04200 [Thermomicrobiales bacterium]
MPHAPIAGRAMNVEEEQAMIRRAMIVIAVSAFALIGFSGAAGAATLSAGALVAKHAGMNGAALANSAGLGGNAEALRATMIGKAEALNAALHS